jgi:hypothetical protein
MDVFDSADRLAGVSGLAPAPHDSAGIYGNFKRPAATAGACYLSAQIAIRTNPALRIYYDRKKIRRQNPHSSRDRLGPADASTSFGPWSATTPPTSPQLQPRRVDNVIENQYRGIRQQASMAPKQLCPRDPLCWEL